MAGNVRQTYISKREFSDFFFNFGWLICDKNSFWYGCINSFNNFHHHFPLRILGLSTEDISAQYSSMKSMYIWLVLYLLTVSKTHLNTNIVQLQGRPSKSDQQVRLWHHFCGTERDYFSLITWQSSNSGCIINHKPSKQKQDF